MSKRERNAFACIERHQAFALACSSPPNHRAGTYLNTFFPAGASWERLHSTEQHTPPPSPTRAICNE